MLTALICLFGLCAPSIDATGEWELHVSRCGPGALVISVDGTGYFHFCRLAGRLRASVVSNEMLVELEDQDGDEHMVRLAVDGDYASGLTGEYRIEAWRGGRPEGSNRTARRAKEPMARK